MKTLTCLVLALGLSASFAYAHGPAALSDRLERPARLSPLAAQSLFTDSQVVDGQVVLVGQDGRVLVRAANGSLSQARVPVEVLLTAVHFVDAQQGWAVGHDGVILHSVDGGRSWQKQLDGRAINDLAKAWAESEVTRLETASAAAADDEALSTALESAQFALEDIQAGSEYGPSRPLLDVWFKNAKEGWAVGAYGMFLHTVDGGQHWQFLAGPENPERLHLNGLLGLADGGLLVAGEGGQLHRSSDGGQHWETLDSGSNASLYKLLQLNGGRLLVLGFGGTLLSSDDQGASRQPLSVPARAGLYGAAQLVDGSLLLGGHGGVLLHSEDGRSFELWQLPGRKNAWLSVAEAAPGQLVLSGNGGLLALSLAELKEQKQ
ncbi:YCF48-related protein [Pseudomonas sp. NBRC 111136]|uniref:YCF48-related protein n=1 Tax=Pseudomonas sp. NBRC 111136 TaxID=1661051 RepID=UPI000760C9E8|nr:YCF48-related protein [Pseudomonas sp. NBRC 111136]